MRSRFSWLKSSKSPKTVRCASVRLETLEDRSVPAVLMASGALSSQPTWGIQPSTPIDINPATFYQGISILTRDINN